MSLPVLPNTTCDIYASSAPPPGAPRLTGVPIFLDEHWDNIRPGGQYTHTALVALGVDVRDGDLLFVPNGSGGTQFNSVFVARRGRGTDLDHKVVYLSRNAAPPPWPTDNV
jgi:hypothetical protein